MISRRMMSVETVDLEPLGDSITNATLLKWNKQVGDKFAEDDVIAVVETDKVTMDIRAKKAGVMSELLHGEGSEVEVKKPFYKMDTDGAAASAAPAAAAAAPKAAPAAAAAAPAASSTPVEVTVNVPSMGDSITQGTIAKTLKNVGDFVKVDDVIVLVETDKVTVEVRADKSGKLLELYAKDGETVDVGKPLYKIDTAAAGAPAAVAAAAAPAKTAGAAAPTKAAEAPKAAAAPAAASKSAAASPSAPAPVAGSRAETRVKMSRMRQVISKRLKQAQNTCAMLTTFQECDMSALINMRNQYKDEFEKKHNVKLGFMSAFVRAATAALQEVPTVNAYIDDATQEVVYRNYSDVSVAVASPTGLVVPVLRNTETMSFADVEKTIGHFSKKAKEGTMSLEDMAGGTFTISNGGVFGSLFGTPIINPPQSAILGMHATKMRAVVVDGQVVARPMMYLALTYDHRLIDGREAVTFLKSIAQKIEDPQRLLLTL